MSEIISGTVGNPITNPEELKLAYEKAYRDFQVAIKQTPFVARVLIERNLRKSKQEIDAIIAGRVTDAKMAVNYLSKAKSEIIDATQKNAKKVKDSITITAQNAHRAIEEVPERIHGVAENIKNRAIMGKDSIVTASKNVVLTTVAKGIAAGNLAVKGGQYIYTGAKTARNKAVQKSKEIRNLFGQKMNDGKNWIGDKGETVAIAGMLAADKVKGGIHATKTTISEGAKFVKGKASEGINNTKREAAKAILEVGKRTYVAGAFAAALGSVAIEGAGNAIESGKNFAALLGREVKDFAVEKGMQTAEMVGNVKDSVFEGAKNLAEGAKDTATRATTIGSNSIELASNKVSATTIKLGMGVKGFLKKQAQRILNSLTASLIRDTQDLSQTNERVANNISNIKGALPNKNSNTRFDEPDLF